MISPFNTRALITGEAGHFKTISSALMFLLWIFFTHSSLRFWCFLINLFKLFIERGYQLFFGAYLL